MRLDNFQLEKPIDAMNLLGLGVEWDLHSYAALRHARFNPDDRSLVFEWYAPEGISNPWGDVKNTFRGCRLRFSGVSLFRIELRESRSAKDITGVSKVIPGEVEYRFRKEWSNVDEFNLLFHLDGGGEIQVASESVVLEGIGGENDRSALRLV